MQLFHLFSSKHPHTFSLNNVSRPLWFLAFRLLLAIVICSVCCASSFFTCTVHKSIKKRARRAACAKNPNCNFFPYSVIFATFWLRVYPDNNLRRMNEVQQWETNNSYRANDLIIFAITISFAAPLDIPHRNGFYDSLKKVLALPICCIFVE